MMMDNGVIVHITRDGDRWDLIAHRYYGQAAAIDGLIAANPHLPLSEQFVSGVHVFVPVLTATPRTAQEDMPPWMR